MTEPGKLKDMLILKKQLQKQKNVVDSEIDKIRIKKRMVHDELMCLKSQWKTALNKSRDLGKKLDDVSNNIRKKRKDGRRGFRMSGLSIDISGSLDPSICKFLNLSTDKSISRIDVMKAIFTYIREYELYLEGDKRYIDLTKETEYLDKLLNTFGIEKNEEKFRIQRFRSYLERFVNI
tara:strand:+ start:180 stop:713 length:534 start_codon:yes stop_codon:yes gene_type:complete